MSVPHAGSMPASPTPPLSDVVFTDPFRQWLHELAASGVVVGADDMLRVYDRARLAEMRRLDRIFAACEKVLECARACVEDAP